jgi:tetratricopeptide (TPR) repeat protein
MNPQPNSRLTFPVLRWLSYGCLFLLMVNFGMGHGDVHQRIEQIGKEIPTVSSPLDLWLERANLWLVDGNHAEALADVECVLQQSPERADAMFLKGRILHLSGKWEQARGILETLLHLHPKAAEAWRELGLVCQACGRAEAGTQALDEAIKLAPMCPPEWIFERVRITEGNSLEGKSAALEWLGNVMKHRPLPVFDEEALRLEMSLKHYAEAESRLNRLIQTHPRPGLLLLKKAKVQRLAGRESAAMETAREAQSRWSSLPESHRQTKAQQQLHADLQLFLTASP